MAEQAESVRAPAPAKAPEPARRVEPDESHEALEARPEIEAELGYRAMLNGRPALAAQRKAAESLAGRAAGARPVQPPAPPNRTGLPDQLKSGVEALSGVSLDGVKVHYNSAAPAQLNALAYAQGNDIHLAPGQEKHLPHEAWHLVQQAQGRVRASAQLKGVEINEDAGLEHEADEMGARALLAHGAETPSAGISAEAANARASSVVMRRVDPDFATAHGAGPATRAQMQTFYDRFVAPEVERFSNRPVDDDLKTDMKLADLVFTTYILGSAADLAELRAKLDRLIAAVNACANDWDATVNARRQTRVDAAVAGAAPANAAAVAAAAATGEPAFREERSRREGAMHHAGVTKPMALRGVDSAAEAQQLLAALQAALNGALGAGFALGQVGVRGSAVTGIRTRTQTPFEQGTGAHQEASDASDLDFFFTSPALEVRIRATQDALLPARRMKNTGPMNAENLHGWLTLPGNGYANAAALDAALTAFSNNAKAQIGRKCDVTFLGAPAANGLAADAGTLIL